jgi:hypothetical protein
LFYTRALRSQAISSGERGEARRIPERSGGRTIGEEAHSGLMQRSLRRSILR